MNGNKKFIFITGNSGKFEEVKRILPDVQQLNIDLIEIQEMDPDAIIKHKLQEASKRFDGVEFNNIILIVEDTSLSCVGLNNFPGPLIKWYLNSLGCDGIYRQVDASRNMFAIGSVNVGCMNLCTGEVTFFKGEVMGNIVEPKGSNGFGWDPIFQPVGCDKTFGEMTAEEKSKYNMRVKAFEKVKECFIGKS